MEPNDIEEMRAKGIKLQMILRYAYYLLNGEILEMEEGKEKARQLKLFMEAYNFNSSSYSFPANFYEENKNDIDKVHCGAKNKFLILSAEKLCEEIAPWIQKWKEENDLEVEKEQIRKDILEKERKKQLQNEIYKTLINEGHIKRSFFDSDKKRERIPQDIMDAVWNRDGGKCVKCGSQENLEFDHIIPHSKGGATSYRNIQILCKKCNIEKTNKIG